MEGSGQLQVLLVVLLLGKQAPLPLNKHIVTITKILAVFFFAYMNVYPAIWSNKMA
jgi:hypothetical protein